MKVNKKLIFLVFIILLFILTFSKIIKKQICEANCKTEMGNSSCVSVPGGCPLSTCISQCSEIILR